MHGPTNTKPMENMNKDKSNNNNMGGFGNMFGMGKSNAVIYGQDKKIKTRFRHVAGMESAKVEI